MEEYSTTDFYTTAVLISKAHKVQRVTTEGPAGKVKRFYFEDSAQLRTLVMQYMNRELHGNVRDFRDAIETTKDLIFSN